MLCSWIAAHHISVEQCSSDCDMVLVLRWRGTGTYSSWVCTVGSELNGLRGDIKERNDIVVFVRYS
jgi:hypothetical protein